MIMDLNEEGSPPLAWNKWSIVAGHESEEERSGVSSEVLNWTKRKRSGVSSCSELVLGLGCSPEDSVESQGSTLSAGPETSLCLGQSNDPNMGMHLRLGLPSQEEEEEDAPPISDNSSSKPYPFVAKPNTSLNPNPNLNPSPSLSRFEERRRKRYAMALAQDKRVHGGCLAMGGIGPDLFQGLGPDLFQGLVYGNNHFMGEYQKRGGLPFSQLKRPAPAPGFSLDILNNNNNGRKRMIPSDVLVPRYMQKPKEEEEEKGVGPPPSAPRLESRVHGATHLSFLASISSQMIVHEDCPEQAERSPMTFEDYPRQARASQDTLEDYPKLVRSLPTTFEYFPQSLARALPPTFKFYPILAKASQTAFEDRRYPEQEKPSQTATSKAKALHMTSED